MKKASEYRQHAEECRVLARGMLEGPQRDQLLEMAATWEKLAIDRSDLIRRHPELSIGDEHREEREHDIALPQNDRHPAAASDAGAAPRLAAFSATGEIRVWRGAVRAGGLAHAEHCRDLAGRELAARLALSQDLHHAPSGTAFCELRRYAGVAVRTRPETDDEQNLLVVGVARLC
jgi:hypothetical protein